MELQTLHQTLGKTQTMPRACVSVEKMAGKYWIKIIRAQIILGIGIDFFLKNNYPFYSYISLDKLPIYAHYFMRAT